MPGFSMCCAGIGDSGSCSTRGGGAPLFAADCLAADFDEADFAADFFAAALAGAFAAFFAAPPFWPDFDPPFFAPCLFAFVAIESPRRGNCPKRHAPPVRRTCARKLFRG